MAAYVPAVHDDLHQAVPHKTKRHHPWLIALGILVLAIVGLAILGAAQSPSNTTCTGLSCTVPPPRVHDIMAPETYTSSDYGFSLQYSTANVTPSQEDSSSISWDAQLNDGSEVSWTFQGTDPNGRDARQIVEDVQSNNFGDATYAYTLPSAELGYTPGYGNVYDLEVAPNGGAAIHERLIIEAAIRNDVAVFFAGMGPYQKTDPNTDDHPNPAETPLVGLGDVDLSLESVRWPGEPPL
jgi:hypothetical protein